MFWPKCWPVAPRLRGQRSSREIDVDWQRRARRCTSASMRTFMASGRGGPGGRQIRPAIPSRLCRSTTATSGGIARDRGSESEVHHLLGHRLQRRRRPDVRIRRERGLAAHRLDGQLHANHQLGSGYERRDVRSQTGLYPASWKYGLGWRDGTPAQKQTRRPTSSTARTHGRSTGRDRHRLPRGRRMPSAISSTCG